MNIIKHNIDGGINNFNNAILSNLQYSRVINMSSRKDDDGRMETTIEFENGSKFITWGFAFVSGATKEMESKNE